MRKIILASTSPRRREILAKTGLQFEVVDSKYEEDLSLSVDPEELASTLALGKAMSVASLYDDALIISADQVITLDGVIFGKPHTLERQYEMLTAFSGQTHQVLTAYVIRDTRNEKTHCHVERSFVRFKKLSNDVIEAYLATKEGLDRAGGYAIQGLGADLVEEIEGDYLNIVGLPLVSLVESLKQFGISVVYPEM